MFEHDSQAFLTGMFLGLLRNHDIPHRIEMDEEGYTPVVFVTLEEGSAGNGPLQVAVMVLP